MLAIQQIDQQYHALFAIRRQKDGLQPGKTLVQDDHFIAWTKTARGFHLRAYTQLLDELRADRQRLPPKTDDARHATGRAQRCPTGVRWQIDKHVTREERLVAFLLFGSRHPRTRTNRAVTLITL